MNHPLRRFFDLVPTGLVRAMAQHHNVVSSPLEDAADNERSGNRYRSYPEQVRVLTDMYLGKADWGNQFGQIIPTVRSFFILGGGVEVSIVAGREEEEIAKRSKEKAEEFLEHNGIDTNKAQKWGKQAAIEGKACVRLYRLGTESAASGAQIDARFLPWLPLNYKIVTPPDDYETYTELTYRLPKLSPALITVPQTKFVYVPFGGLIGDVNTTPPLMGGIITQLKNLDKEMQRWDAINDLYAAPTLIITCDSMKDAKEISEALFPSGNSPNWKVGKAIVAGAKGVKVYYLEVSAQGMKSIQDSITNLQQVISGATGVPIQFLGRSDQLSNRSTSDNLLEQIAAATHDDRLDWKSFFTEMIQKALALLNDAAQGDFDPKSVEAIIPEISTAQMNALTSTWLPLQQSRTVSRQTVREQIPGVDEETETKRLKAEEEAEIALAGAMNPAAGENNVGSGSSNTPSTSPNGGREF